MRAYGARGGATPLAEEADGEPAAALRRLLEGNARFADGQATVSDRSLERLQELGAEQRPFASVLGCADSRVPVEIVFDQGFGDVFVTRVAGNVASPEVVGSLEYAAEVLGTELLMVLGHSGCGAVQATVEAGEVPGSIGALYPYIRPAVLAAGERGLEAVVEANVVNQVEGLLRASPVLAARLRAGTLGVVGAVIDFQSGRVRTVSPLRTGPAAE